LPNLNRDADKPLNLSQSFDRADAVCRPRKIAIQQPVVQALAIDPHFAQASAKLAKLEHLAMNQQFGAFADPLNDLLCYPLAGQSFVTARLRGVDPRQSHVVNDRRTKAKINLQPKRIAIDHS
jgi:hypothetical protein